MEPIIVGAMAVTGTRTRVKVLWQDGNIEDLASSDLMPYHTLDDLDCWYVCRRRLSYQYALRRALV